jgi:hypothetical protein
MVALLTYDDSVKRLLFAKKIPNHDVLSGLLTTLQQRIKQRNTPTNVSQNAVKPSPMSLKASHNNSTANNINNNSNGLNKSSNNLTE